MANCTQINIPELDIEAEACNGKYYSTLCVIHEPPLISLGFPAGNASLAQILPAISNRLSDQTPGGGGGGLIWRGAWVSGSNYEQNDIVEYLGSSYICVVDVNNSVSNPLADTSNWDVLAQKGANGSLGLQGLVWRGAWSDDNEYDTGDAVEFNGSSYICVVAITTTPNPNPINDPTKWDLLAQSAEQEPQSAYTVKVNNTNATAVPVEITYRSSGLQILADDPIFSDSQTPTGTVNKSYNWHQIGSLVTVNISVEYATWLVQTGEWVRFNLPSDMPAPTVPTGLGGSNRVIYTGVGSAYETDISITQTAGAQTMSLMRANGSSEPVGFHFLIPYTIDALNPFKVFRMTLQYFTA